MSRRRLPIGVLVVLSTLIGFTAAWNNQHVSVRTRRFQQMNPSMAGCAPSPSAAQHKKCQLRIIARQNLSSFNPSKLTSHNKLSESSSSELEPPNEDGDGDNDQGWLARVKGYFLQKRQNDGLTFKQRLAKMGVATVLSYGMISNLSYAILIALAWYTFAAKTRLSPLAPGQWKPFLGVYAGFWVFNNVIRPLRVGLSIAIAPSLDRLVLFFQNRLKVSKPVAITVTVVFVNVIGTTVLMCGGILLASLLAGVPLK